MNDMTKWCPECRRRGYASAACAAKAENPYQQLRADERYAEERDFGHEVAQALGVGTTYKIFADPGGTFFVAYRPDGPASLRWVIMRERLAWSDAMDEVRDAVAEELLAEGIG